MKVCFIRPSLKNHKNRGTGVYFENLKRALLKYTDIEFLEISHDDTVPRDCNIIHIPYFDPFFLTLPAVQPKRTIITVHDLIPLKFPKHFPVGFRGSLKWQIQKQKLKKMSTIITDSDASKMDIVNFTEIPDHRVQIVHLAPDEIFFTQSTEGIKRSIIRKYNLPKKFVLYVGDANWNKNLLNLILSIKKTRYPLVLVSKAFKEKHVSIHPWTRELLQAQAEASNNSQIFALSNLDKSELLALYQMATVFCFPSFYEGFGLPVVEAFASGCPVVTTHSGSLVEIADQAAIIVEPNNPDSIEAAITRIFNSESLQRELVHKGSMHVKKFSWKKTAYETAKIYEDTSAQIP